MKRIELLSPAGDMECLKMAIKCGCDAVYISGKLFGARAYAKNFSLEEIKDAVKYCHLYDVKLYITVNTLIDEEKLDEVISYIEILHEYGVDAIIVQDIGLISMIHQKFPNLEIHASTQTHNANNDSLLFLKDIGCSRAVLAREMSMSEIRNLDADIELEVFIHGALCIAYSGCCLMSSRMFGRSGNKGECAGPCRFCYDLYLENKKVDLKDNYLLSTKELCFAKDVGKLIDLGVSSLKIEGRMKSKYYVGYVTAFYRKLIDQYYNNDELSFSNQEYINLLKLYNRGFTNGYLGGVEDIVNSKTCNHQGYSLGKVISWGKYLKIKLFDDIKQGDGIRFSNGKGMICNYIYDENMLLINKSSKNSIIYLDNKLNIKENCLVSKTQDISLEQMVDNISERKVHVDFEVIAYKNKKLVISIIDSDIRITKEGYIVDNAIKNETKEKDIEEKLNKLGNTPFVLNKVIFDIEKDIFIPIKVINNLKRDLVNELIRVKQNSKKEVIKEDIIFESNCEIITHEISFLVRNEMQLKILLDYDVLIYVEDVVLYNKYKNYSNVYYRASRIRSNKVDSCCTVISNSSGIAHNSNNISDVYMNVFNSFTLNYFHKYFYKVGLSPELGIGDIKNIIRNYKNKYNRNPNVEVLVYGKLELMIMKYCPVKSNLCNEKCNVCFNKAFYLDDRNNHRFRLLGDNNHYMRVFDYRSVSMIDSISVLKNIGVTNFRIDLLDEEEEEILFILDKIMCY